jgi:dephospho-CoA kinase
MINKIFINGRCGAGKDALADHIVQKYRFTKIAFADPIYEIAYKYFGMKYKTRELLQNIGQKMREVKGSVWIDYLFNKIESSDNKLWIISDLRQANEYSIALEKGFLPLRISADLDLRIDRLWKRDGHYPDAALLENESETGADKYKYFEINNNGTLEDLYKQIDWIMEQDWTEYIKNLQMEFMLEQIY